MIEFKVVGFKIFDCTIRDGGHLNGWRFDDACVRESYSAAVSTGVDYFEIGYRSRADQKSLDKFARCGDDFLLNLIEPDPKCKLAVMLDASKSGADDIKDFKQCRLSPIKAIRVATYPNELHLALEMCENLKNKGYETFLVLMAVSEFKEEHFEILKRQNKNVFDGVVFADSFGSFMPKDIEKYYKRLVSSGFESIGFHAHNNLQLAFANSLKALGLGAQFIDATIYGMGRGAGGLPIELLAGYLGKNPAFYIDVIEKFYLDEYARNPWGYGLCSLIGGLKNIHPHYVSELSKKQMPKGEIWSVADAIKNTCPTSFNKAELERCLDGV